MHQPPTGTVTFLFTDIKGSTKLWQDEPLAMGPALARHDQLLHQILGENGGFIFKTMGDAFCAAFATAPEALAGALAAQRALTIEPWVTRSPLRVCMALHTGSAEERDGDYFGPPLNRVARLMAAGHGGQILISAATQELVRDQLPIDAALSDLGSASLKDLARPERVFQLLHPSLPDDFPPLRALNNPELPNNLPQQPTSFIGREKEVAEVKALLAKTRLLTLTGAGGSGKTRLSLQVAADLLDGDGDGVWLVEFAALTDPDLVPQAVADVLGIPEQAGQTIRRTLMEALISKRLLLVLDNCEHLIGACASLATELLRGCPGVHLLASSREPLNVAGEQTYRVPSLSLPDPRKPGPTASLSQYESVRLFIERAQAVKPSFIVTDANAPALAQVCWRLDGIPLALELAAARVRSLSMEEINTRLDNRFRLLTGGARSVLPRQQTLRALIDWGYDLLTAQEQRLLGCLSAFSGGWTLAASEAVGAGDGVEDWEVLDLLTSLVDKSLVVYEEADGKARYRLLETVRQYGSDRLGERGNADAVQERAASWFLDLAETAEPQLTGPEQASWLERLETEHDNLRAGLGWYAHKSERESTDGLDGGVRLAGALWRFWAVRGHYSEGRHWMGWALSKTQGASGSNGEAAAARAKALNGAGYLAYNQSDYDTAQAMYEECLALRRQTGDQWGVAASLNNLGNVAYEYGEYARARALYEESLGLQRQLGDQAGVAGSLGNLGNVAHEQGNLTAAWALHEECLATQRLLGDRRGIANSLNNLGNIAHDQGDYSGARALHEESLTIQRELGNRRGIANSLNGLGNVFYEQSDIPGARAFYEESLTIQQKLGNQQGVALSLEGMSYVAYRQGQRTRAARLWGAAFSLREIVGCPMKTAEQERVIIPVSSSGGVPDEDAFTAGKAMTLEQAVEYALSDEGDAPVSR